MPTNEEVKVAVIKEIQKMSEQYDVVARTSAMQAIRNPKDETAAKDAAKYVAISDALGHMATDVINLLHASWPRESKDGK